MRKARHLAGMGRGVNRFLEGHSGGRRPLGRPRRRWRHGLDWFGPG